MRSGRKNVWTMTSDGSSVGSFASWNNLPVHADFLRRFFDINSICFSDAFRIGWKFPSTQWEVDWSNLELQDMNCKANIWRCSANNRRWVGNHGCITQLEIVRSNCRSMEELMKSGSDKKKLSAVSWQRSVVEKRSSVYWWRPRNLIKSGNE